MTDTFFSRMKEKMFARTQEAQGRISFNAAEDTIKAPHILDATRTEAGYLTGQFLVATPLVHGSLFQKSVIFVFQHSSEGAMGLIINQPLERVSFSSLLDATKINASNGETTIPVYFGGPVEKTRGFVLHSTDYLTDATLMHHGEVAITASSTILNDMAAGRGPKHTMLCVGYAGWSAGQLEGEIAENSWLTVPSSASLIFHTEDELKWATAGKTLGVDMNFYSTTIGHA